jgi:ferredoxin--NADP+ reductase
MEIFWTKVKDIIEETSEINTYILECPEEFTWEAGAHTHFALEGFNIGEKPNRSLVRHMSISTLPEEEVIGITTRVKEECSEFKSILRSEGIGKKVALFKTSTNMPLKREHRPIYLLSSGVGIATFRPLLLDYLKDDSGVASIHSLNVDSTGDFLFGDIFQSDNISVLQKAGIWNERIVLDKHDFQLEKFLK